MVLLILLLLFACPAGLSLWGIPLCGDTMAFAQTTNGTPPWMMTRQTTGDSLWEYHHHLNRAHEADGKFQRMPSASKSGSGRPVSAMVSPGKRRTINGGTTTLQTNLPITDDQVYALLFDATHNLIYLGGVFSYVGPNTGFGVALDNSTGNVESGFPYVNGPIYAVAPDGSGGWYIGGDFTSVGGIALCGIAHINADKSVDASWDPNPNGPVIAIKVSPNGAGGSTVYVGGEFTDGEESGHVTIGGADRNGIAAIDANPSSGNYGKAITSWNPNPDGLVFALATSPDGNTVYAGGNFRALVGSTGVVTRNYIAAISASTGTATDWDPDANGDVYGLAVSSDGNTVYAGGRFDSTSSIGGADRNHIAAIDASTGNATSWNPNVNNIVTALAFSADSTIIYCGGNFSNVGSSTRNQIAAIDASTGNATSWDPNVNGPVFSLAVSPNGTGGSTVYAGGDFTTLAGGTVTRNRIAAIDASTGNATSWNPNAGSDVEALALSPNGTGGSTVYAGGAFTSVGGQTRNNIAAVDASTGTVTSWNPNANGKVFALALSLDGNTVYAGGDFNDSHGGPGTATIGGADRNYIAAIDASTGSATGWNPNANGGVSALAVSSDGNTIYAGGAFTMLEGLTVTRSYIAAIDASTGNATSWDPEASGSVLALAVDGSTVYAVGWFTTLASGTVTRGCIAAIDASGNATSWDPSLNPNGDDYVDAIALSSTNKRVYVGGLFQSVEGTNTYNFAGMDNPGDVSLPVQATDFTARADVGSVTLTWKTQSEVKNAGFNVLRQESTNANWELVGGYKTDKTLAGLGTSSTGHAYQYVDSKVKCGATYNYKIQSVSTDGTIKDVKTLTGIMVDVPKDYALYQNYPNPFNPSTTIRFDLKQQSTVTLEIYNVLGQRVESWNYGTMDAGEYNKAVAMSALSSGVYYYRINVVGGNGQRFVSVKKLVLMK